MPLDLFKVPQQATEAREPIDLFKVQEPAKQNPDAVDPSYRGKRVSNPDGSVSTERTITVGLGNKFYNIPSLINGVQRSPDEAIQLFKSGKIKAVGSADTLEDAERLATERSQMLGMEGAAKPLDLFGVQEPEKVQGSAVGPGKLSLLQKADRTLGKILPPAMHYSGMEAAGRLWDLPANVGYGMWEGGKKVLKGDVKEGLKEPVKAGIKTLKGEGYYDMEQAGLPIPESNLGRIAGETAWGIIKNPLNVIMPYKQYRAIKTTPIKPGTMKAAGNEKGRLVVPGKSPEETPGALRISEAEYENPGRLVDKRITEKYKDLFRTGESEAPHEIYDGISERTLTPESLDKFIQTAENKPKAIQDVKAAIADQMGELIQTHKYEGAKDGKAIEKYIDQILEVVKKNEIPDSGLQNQRTNPNLAQTETGRLSDNRGITPESKPLPGFKDTIASQRGSVSLEPLKKTIEGLEDSHIIQGVKAKAKRTAEGLSEALHSPAEVYKRDPKTGTKIYQLIDHADQSKNAFLSVEGDQLVKSAAKIKEGSESSLKVGKALDGKLDPNTLKGPERNLYDFMREKYDFLIQKYARSAADSEEGYLKVLKAVNNKHAAKVKTSDLPPEKVSQYGQLKGRLVEIRKGRPLEQLSKSESGEYWKTRKEMSDILTGEWKASLSTGEQKAYDVLSQRIKDYLPHIFDQDELISAFKNEAATIRKKLETATSQSAITQYKDRLRMLNDSLTKLEGGSFVTYDALPRNVRFRFFESRKGKAGYSFDAIKAYQTYLHGLAKKIYDEPAIRQVSELHKDLDPSLKSYNKFFVRRYMGWDRHKLDDLAGAVSSFEWMRTLGANPRSAIVNLTQRINTVAEVGVKHSLKGEKLAFTKEGKRLFDSTGIAKEIPSVLMEGTVPEGMEKARAILGYMFNKVELGNRRHAFLSAYSKFKASGLNEKEATQKAIDSVHKTQFRYGKIGMPKALTHPVGRLAGQFWSYPIKQGELIVDWAKNDPGKLIKYLAISEGGNYALNEFLGMDLSNALGFGLNYGEAVKALRGIPEKDWRGFWRHTKLTFQSGGGLLPSGLGPAVSGAWKVIEKMGEGKGIDQLKKEMMPVQLKRFLQAYESYQGKKGELYPVNDSQGHIMYYLTAPELITRTIGPRPAKETREFKEWKAGQLLEQERREVLQDITRAIVDNQTDKANSLIKKYQVIPSPQMVENESLKRKTSYEERGRLKKPGVKEIYKMQRERD